MLDEGKAALNGPMTLRLISLLSTMVPSCGFQDASCRPWPKTPSLSLR